MEANGFDSSGYCGLGGRLVLGRKCLGISCLLYSEQRGILGDSSVVLRFVLNICLMGQCHVLVVFSPHVALGDMCFVVA